MVRSLGKLWVPVCIRDLQLIYVCLVVSIFLQKYVHQVSPVALLSFHLCLFFPHLSIRLSLLQTFACWGHPWGLLPCQLQTILKDFSGLTRFKGIWQWPGGLVGWVQGRFSTTDSSTWAPKFPPLTSPTSLISYLSVPIMWTLWGQGQLCPLHEFVPNAKHGAWTPGDWINICQIDESKTHTEYQPTFTSFKGSIKPGCSLISIRALVKKSLLQEWRM